MSNRTPFRPMVLCGPSGSGKSTLLKRMLEEYPEKFGFSVSHTTRKPRPGEINHKHYHFVDTETMKSKIQANLFIETATYSGNLYGTSKAAVEEVEKMGKICVLDIDVQGVKQVQKSDLNPLSVFIRPPSLEVLKSRLVGRKTETDEGLQRRLKMAEEEILFGTTPGNFDLVIVNDNLDKAYATLKEFVETKVFKQNNVK